MENYLLTNHKNDIIDILNNSEDSSSPSILVNLTHLHQSNPELFTDVINDVHKESSKWSTILFDLQKRFAENDNFLDPNWEIKVNGRVRFINLPELDVRNRLTFPTNDDLRKFVQIKGTVLRTTQPKFLECKMDYFCRHCQSKITVEGEYGLNYVADPPSSCPNSCKGRPYSDSTNVVNENFITYQEIKIMEAVSKKSTPSVMDVTLDNDLVESCQPGDSVTICGTLEPRYTFKPKMEVKVVIRANSVNNKMKQVNIGNELPEHLILLRAEWNELIEKFGELGARDIIVQSICPDVYGMYLAKLAVALAICSGYDSSSCVSGLRNHSHVLLIGDPGLAKSRLLKFAAAVSSRSSFVTGSGISSAGLTAAAIQEAGEWHLEAGALPLADNGICCIDEFNLMSESDKASLHEAMEQQTIHISKAGIACKLNTRCSIIAATNPKNLYSMCDREGTSAINLGLASSLTSRFDLVLVLRDEFNKEWDTTVANHIFNEIGPAAQNENIYDLAKLQAHFAAVRDFDPIVSDSASRILKAYYLACRGDEERDAGRTTLRFNDSLYRLAKSHAKLLFRHEVTEIDAVLVIMLMESSFGFGRILTPKNVVTEEIPLGPSDDQIYELMDKLNLEEINPRNDETNIIQNVNGIANTQASVSEVGLGNTSNANITEPNDRPSQNERTNTQVTNPDVLLQNADVHSQIMRRTTHESNTSNDKNVHVFDASKYAFQKRRLNRVSTTVTDENMSITTSASVSVPNYDSISSHSQPNHHRNNVVSQPLFQLQNIETIPSTTSHFKRHRMEFDDDELDKIFTLDDPIPKSTEERNVTGVNNVPVVENLPSSDPEAKRFRIFNNCTDEDLDEFNLDF